MANKERIDYLLLDIRELEKLIAAQRDSEVHSVSFFSQSFDIAHKILKDLHALEAEQVEILRQRMEAHRQLIDAIPVVQPVEIAEPIVEPVVPPVTRPSVETPQPASPDKDIPAEKKTTLFLSEVLEKKNLSDFRKAFSLNDRFRFRKELFAGDEARMNQTISDLNDIHSYEESVMYLLNVLKWNPEDGSVADFIKLLEKRF